MLNFPIDSRDLMPLVPRGTEIDSWAGTTHISLVAFQFLHTKVCGVTVPLHRNFEEINLRFYVRSRGPEGWRRGVVFVREVVPRMAIAQVARWLYNENYVACATRSEVTVPSSEVEGAVEYGWKHRGAWLSVGARFSGNPRLPETDSIEAFIAEHYWGYSVLRDGGTVEYHVEHPQWTLWAASESWAAGDMSGFYGPRWSHALASAPSSAFVADGSPVTVRTGHRIDERPTV
jgi:uncharacterized protein YqjF (DUF2071 family)